MKNSRLALLVQQLLAQSSSRETIKLAVGELLLHEMKIEQEWKELTTSTPLENMKLNIRVIPAQQQCMWCFLVYHPGEKETICPQCRSVGAKILSGEEFYLEAD
ncbi:MAG: hydrogenase maturation nickel metallochaperone HypA [Anaerolineales bacterium]|jgi:Zn finger protein HypA/HybF involved in hydrogenase expression|uniref:hydrogenase maturation nickel metallochaperone HypA n=1 Tax=Candidatus Villigracilis vicinus TaxID=3140679 RepID=UPI003135795B|nr:hydrogenase maturation nickel metallochaperone HypA [Anaerolineales bacterium]MBK7448317.1 hydrogenase maturation nickel metallochaperone HypA [Anaerolineales bacterium]